MKSSELFGLAHKGREAGCGQLFLWMYILVQSHLLVSLPCTTVAHSQAFTRLWIREPALCGV